MATAPNGGWLGWWWPLACAGVEAEAGAVVDAVDARMDNSITSVGKQRFMGRMSSPKKEGRDVVICLTPVTSRLSQVTARRRNGRR